MTRLSLARAVGALEGILSESPNDEEEQGTH